MKSSRKKIIFIHLLNDFSGSPLVLSQVINSIPSEEYDKDLFTSTSSSTGFLTGLKDVKTHHFWYKWSVNPWWRLFTYTTSQMLLFFRLLTYWRSNCLIYVNTLLPFGAALAGKLMGKKVIYHVHETSMNPPALKKFLRFVANSTATCVFHVSNFLAEKEKFSSPINKVIYNTLSKKFVSESLLFHHISLPVTPFKVLMLCSLKKYKGVEEFLTLARLMPLIEFELVLNANPEEVANYVSKSAIPANLKIHSSQNNVHPFYQRSSLVLNLSHPDKWIETFGMTALEAMYYKLPVIVPPVGGIAEIVIDGYNGFHADYRSLFDIQKKIELLATNDSLYKTFSANAYQHAQTFNEQEFKQKINENLKEVIYPSTDFPKTAITL